ncbi:MAG: PaaX family transcriptional regulator C-terminal domain-containing protein [Streptosporangiaceae bacterium]
MPADMTGNGAASGLAVVLTAEQPAGSPGRPDRGAKSARGLLLTVLGEFVLRSGGTAWTAALIDVLGRLGVEEKATRQALMRTAADGWLSAERTGRRTCWRLTASAEQLLTDGSERIYGFTAARQAWDGTWLLVLARVPETDRPARHRLRTRLTWAGFGSPAPGVWLSPDTSRQAEAEQVLASAGLLADAQIFKAEYAAGGPLAAMARSAWDLDQIEQRYEEFFADFSQPAGADELARLTELVHRWRRFPWIDPVLPAQLLPDPWQGSVAARLFRARHAELAPGAMAEWQRIMQAAS